VVPDAGDVRREYRRTSLPRTASQKKVNEGKPKPQKEKTRFPFFSSFFLLFVPRIGLPD